MEEFDFPRFGSRLKKSILAVAIGVMLAYLPTLIFLIFGLYVPATRPLLQTGAYMAFLETWGKPLVIVLTCLYLLKLWWKK